MLVNAEWYSLVPYITKKKHRLEMYERAKKDNPNLALEDFIKSSWVRYELRTNKIKDLKSNKTENNATISINQDVLEEEIVKEFSKMEISEEEYKKFVEFSETKAFDIRKANQERQSSINMRIWSIEKERREYIKKYMWREFREWEQELYEETLKEFDDKERILREELNNIIISERKQTMELDMAVKILNNAAKTYKNASRVRKKKFCKLLISNICIDKRKRLTIRVNPWLRSIFTKKKHKPKKGGDWTLVFGFGDQRATIAPPSYHIFLAITAPRNCKSSLSLWITFANSDKVDPVVVTSSTNKNVDQFGIRDKSSVLNTHFKFAFLFSRFRCNWEIVYFFFEASFNIGIHNWFARDSAKSWDWLYHFS